MLKTPDDKSYLVDIDNGLLTLTFNRPELGNAIPSTAVPGLTALFQAAQEDLSVRCILVKGTGKVFSAGGDVASFARSLEQSPVERQADFGARLQRAEILVEAVVAFDRPVVAAVNGPAAGAGLLYPLVADVVIGNPFASFVFAHQRIGLSPDGGVTYVLPRVIAPRLARMLLLTAAKVDAEEAKAIGLLHRIVDAEVLNEEALKAARKLAAAPLTAVRAAKRMIVASPETSLADQMRAETASIVACVGDPDFDEGVRAFMEKRPAKFGQK
jgi:2-(1,2-epoxy-1,2-dihydrophenyl)acetyl-CoA isomerase